MAKKKHNKNKNNEEIIEEEIIEEVIEEEPKKNKKDKKDKKKKTKVNGKLSVIKRFLNNPLPILITQTIIIIILLFAYSNVSKYDYMYKGKIEESEVVSVSNIHYFLNNDMNYFHASSATFLGEEKTIYSYNIGYYVKDGDELIQFATRSGNSDTGLSLTAVVNDMSGWSFGELSNQVNFFTTEVKKNMKDLHFVIYASTNKDSDEADVYYDIPAEILQISK